MTIIISLIRKMGEQTVVTVRRGRRGGCNDGGQDHRDRLQRNFRPAFCVLQTVSTALTGVLIVLTSRWAWRAGARLTTTTQLSVVLPLLPAGMVADAGQRWQSSELSRSGNLSMACVQQTEHEQVLSLGCALSKPNLASGASCVLVRPELEGAVDRNTSGRRWIEAVQSIPPGQRLLSSTPFYKEHAYHRCNPSSFGPVLKMRLKSNASSGIKATNEVVELAFAFAGGGLHGGRGVRDLRVTVELRSAGLRTRRRFTDDALSVGLAARLVGPSIMALSPTRAPKAQRCSWFAVLRCPSCCHERLVIDFEYTATDAGTYLLEVLLTHALGEPTNHLVLRTLAVVPDLPRNVSQSTGARRICSHGHNPGRWVRQAAGVVRDELLDDQVGYNRGYLWTPYECRYRRYTRQRFGQCLRRCGYRHFGFSGDSIGREQLTGIFQLAQGYNATVNGKAFKRTSNELVVPRDTKGGFPRLRLLWNVPPPLSKQGGGLDVFVFVPLIATLLAEGMPASRATRWLSFRLMELREACGKHRVVCVYIRHPTVQRTPILDEFAPGARYGQTLAMRKVTRHHVRSVSAPLTRLARRLGFHFVDAHDVTDARWYSSWDGVHYLLSSRHSEKAAADSKLRYQWQGGVAHTVTTVLLNALCNRCLTP